MAKSEEIDKSTTIKVRKSTVKRLDVYRRAEGSNEKAINKLIDFFEKV